MTRAGRLLAALAVAVILGLGCSSGPDEPTPGPTPADGGSTHRLTTADGFELTARMWRSDPVRVAIYLHEYRQDQAGWWAFATAPRRIPVSAITFDFRGHGVSEGDPGDVLGMVEDARAAVALAREEGFGQIMLVGAGMGAAVAVAVAADQPDLIVVGLSTPSAFDMLDTLATVPPLGDRLALVATEDDLSAAHSLGELRATVDLPEERVRLYPGRDHGVDMVSEPDAVARPFLDELLETFWPRYEGALR